MPVPVKRKPEVAFAGARSAARGLSLTRMMLSDCYEQRLNERAVKLLLPSVTVSSAHASMPFCPANGLLPTPL